VHVPAVREVLGVGQCPERHAGGPAGAQHLQVQPVQLPGQEADDPDGVGDVGLDDGRGHRGAVPDDVGDVPEQVAVVREAVLGRVVGDPAPLGDRGGGEGGSGPGRCGALKTRHARQYLLTGMFCRRAGGGQPPGSFCIRTRRGRWGGIGS
jgi:hypothetical protein